MRAMQCDICGTVIGDIKEATYYQFPVPHKVTDGSGLDDEPGISSQVEVCETCAAKAGGAIVAELLLRYNYVAPEPDPET